MFCNEMAQIKIHVVALDRPSRYLDGRLCARRSNRLEIESAEAIPLDAVVSVEYLDGLLMGTVLSCSGAFRTQVLVEHTLTGLQSLAQLREQLLGSNADREYATLAQLD